MKNFFLVCFLCSIFFSQQADAQSWDRAIGIRLGFPNSITYKQFVTENAAVEGILGTRGFLGYRSINIAAAYQIHNDLLQDSFGGLRWYYGAGAGLNMHTYNNDFAGVKGGVSIGVQGYLGVDYTFSEAPINISLDWIPTYFITGFSKGFLGGSGSIAIRYIF